MIGNYILALMGSWTLKSPSKCGVFCGTAGVSEPPPYCLGIKKDQSQDWSAVKARSNTAVRLLGCESLPSSGAQKTPANSIRLQQSLKITAPQEQQTFPKRETRRRDSRMN